MLLRKKGPYNGPVGFREPWHYPAKADGSLNTRQPLVWEGDDDFHSNGGSYRWAEKSDVTHFGRYGLRPVEVNPS